MVPQSSITSSQLTQPNSRDDFIIFNRLKASVLTTGHWFGKRWIIEFNFNPLIGNVADK
jgi:hypothetical protein